MRGVIRNQKMKVKPPRVACGCGREFVQWHDFRGAIMDSMDMAVLQACVHWLTAVKHAVMLPDKMSVAESKERYDAAVSLSI